MAGVAAGLVILLAVPEPALAWGPGAHVYLGSQVLGMLELLGRTTAPLLYSYPGEFLYGTLAPDITVAKRHAPVGRHSHHWHVGFEILEAAGSHPRRRAAALGYLCHLAADVVAHGMFVPRMLLLTSSTRSIGHSYWEHRMDAALDERYPEEARRLVARHEGGDCDDLLREVMARTLFSFDTSRRLYQEMLRWSNDERWQNVFGHLVENSRWRLAPEERDRYLAASLELTLDLLEDGPGSTTAEEDPIGHRAVQRAKRLRRDVLRDEPWGHGEALLETADRHFPVPGREPAGAGLTDPAPVTPPKALSAGAPEPSGDRPYRRRYA